MGYCEYEHWSSEEKKMVTCDCESVGQRYLISNNVGRAYELCAFHLAFVEDATGTFSKSKKKSHPADRGHSEWLKEARKAYGCKRINWGAAFPLGIPVTAGPMPKVWGTA